MFGQKRWNRLKRGILGLRLGPNNAVNTTPIISSCMWCLHAKYSNFHCSFCSSRTHAPLVGPVLLAVVSKLIPITSSDTSHSLSSSNVALAWAWPVPVVSFTIPNIFSVSYPVKLTASLSAIDFGYSLFVLFFIIFRSQCTNSAAFS